MRSPLPALLLLIAAPALAGQPKKRPEDHVQGKQLWEQSCWYCHGVDNDGKGPAAGALTSEVPDLRGAITPNRYDMLAKLVMDGSPTHPAFSTELDKHQARRIMVYLEKLQREAAPREAAPREAAPREAATKPPKQDEPSEED